MSCKPTWDDQGLSCPYGQKLALEVTYPKDPSGWQVISVIYGYMPWALCFAILLLFVIRRGTRELAFGLLPLITAGINELVKLGIKEPRPLGSCLTSCGMPSSHSAVAIGLFLYLVLDAAYRIKNIRLIAKSFLPAFEVIRRTGLKIAKGLMVVPSGSVSQGEFGIYLAFWAPLLLPVPLSRVLLNDHSPAQAMAGTLVGCLAVALWFPFMLYLRLKLRDDIGKKFLYIFVHNYDVPEGWELDDTDEATGSMIPPAVTDEPGSDAV